MKRIYVLLCAGLLFAGLNLTAQTPYKIAVQNSKDGKLTLTDFIGDMPVEGYSGNEIIITSNRSHQIPDRAKGLKPLYSGGTDNTGIGLAVEKNGNDVTVRCLLPIGQRSGYKIQVPDNLALKIKSGCERSNTLTIQNIKNEIEINNCHSVKLRNVTGPLVLSTIAGKIDVVLADITSKPYSIASVSGDVDITLPAKAAVNLEMSSMSGNVYTDFDFPSEQKDLKQISGAARRKLNGGGTDLKIRSISGDIFLRKAN